jgi:ketosteroid isomerase-like protein
VDVLGGTFGAQYIHDYVEANALAVATQRPFKQHFFGYIHAENGKIKLLREVLNIVATARAFFPNGLADIPQPETV